jgi:hypothetical protein
MLRGHCVVLSLAILAGCARPLTKQQAEEASIEELRRARAKMVDIGNVDIGTDREPYRERLVMQAGPKLGWSSEDTRRAAKGIAWVGMTSDQLWWSWGEAWKKVPLDGGGERWEWGPWYLRGPARSAVIAEDKVTEVKVGEPAG